MYARIMHVSLKPDKVETAAALWGPGVSKYKKDGLHAGYMFLLDKEAGKVLSVTIWESEEACRANTEGGALNKALEPFRELFAEEPWNEFAPVGAKVLPDL